MLTTGIYFLTKINTDNRLDEISTIYHNGQIEEAQKQLLEYTKENKSDYLGWTILGHTFLDQENFEKAIDAYTQGVNADPNAFSPHSGLGMTYAKQGKFEKAKNEYESANQLSPNKASVIGNLAGLYDDLGEIEKAIEYAEKSIKIDSTDATLYANLSIYYNKAQQFDKRDLMFNKAKQLGYDDMQSLTDSYNNYNDTTRTE
jgi:Flp pilus assembly protein TadD